MIEALTWPILSVSDADGKCPSENAQVKENVAEGKYHWWPWLSDQNRVNLLCHGKHRNYKYNNWIKVEKKTLIFQNSLKHMYLCVCVCLRHTTHSMKEK